MGYEDSVYLAKLAEQAERYEEMVENMKAVASADQELSVEERNLLSVAYKNVIGARLLIKEYRQKIEAELGKICEDILEVLEKHLIPSAQSGESKVFYHKMVTTTATSPSSPWPTSARPPPTSPSRLTSLPPRSPPLSSPPTHPIRLGLALNFSVFYYEILNSPDKACQMAKTSFDEAIAELDTLSEESYKDSTLIMQLLRDNLTLWTSSEAEPSGEAAAAPAEAQAESKDTADAPAGTEDKPAQ
ncbi:hypothetical protein Q7P37_004298 [Cladosporium fusiforme]